MASKQEITTSIAFTIATTAMASLTSDWFYFKEGPHQVQVDSHTSCLIYKYDSYTLFGTICGVSIADVETHVTTLQILITVAFAFALLQFFLLAFNRIRTRMIVFTSSIIAILSLTTVVLWSVYAKAVLPSDTIVNFHGSAWFLAMACAVAAVGMVVIQISM